MSWFLNPWALLGATAICISAATGGYFVGRSQGAAAVQQRWDADMKKRAEDYAKLLEEMRHQEAFLQNAADKLRQEKDREIRSLNARAAALADSLRKRESRPDQMSESASDGKGSCTGKELYREDGEFLVRLAREADEMTQNYIACTKQYEAAMKKK